MFLHERGLRSWLHLRFEKQMVWYFQSISYGNLKNVRCIFRELLLFKSYHIKAAFEIVTTSLGPAKTGSGNYTHMFFIVVAAKRAASPIKNIRIVSASSVNRP